MIFDSLKMKQKYTEAGFDEAQSVALVEGLQEGQSELATKADLDHKIDNLRTDLDRKIDNLRTDLDHKIDNLRVELKGDISRMGIFVTSGLSLAFGIFLAISTYIVQTGNVQPATPVVQVQDIQRLEQRIDDIERLIRQVVPSNEKSSASLATPPPLNSQ